MPPREKEYSAVVLVLDVGITSNQSGYLANARKCTSELLQRKLMAESNDRFGLVLLGTDKAKNELNYDHVTLVDRNLAVVDWELLDHVENHVKGTLNESDWLDGVVVAMHFLKENTQGTKCTSKKVVLISDIGGGADISNFDIILDNMKREEVEFTFIGPSWRELNDENGKEGTDQLPNPTSNGDSNSDSHQNQKPMSEHQKASKTLIDSLVDTTDGLICDIEAAMDTFLYRERRAKKPFPWKVALEIGPNVRINTVGYIQVRREPPKSWKKCLAHPQNPGQEIDELKAETVFVKDNEDQEVLEDTTNIIESFKYGKEPIPVDDEVKELCKYESGPKSLKVIGFLKQSELPRHVFLGDGCMTFQPVDEDEHSNIALSALAYAMLDTSRCAIVRRVYRNGSTPRIGVLVPEYRTSDDDENRELSIVYIELPYCEDVREYEFAPIYTDEIRPNEEQLAAVDDFIQSMMLVNDEREDMLQSENVMNPTYQHLYKCLAHRALKAGQVLPEVSSHIKRLMTPPEKIQKSSEKSAQKVEQLFKLEEVSVKESKKTGDNIFSKRKLEEESENSPSKKLNSGDISLTSASVTEVGTTTPVQDFEQLLSSGSGSLISIAQQLENVIIKLVRTSFGDQLFDKILSCLRVYRRECLERDNPNLYNDYLREFKFAVESIGKTKIILEIATEDLGLISKSDHTESRVEDEEARRFLTPMDTKVETKVLSKEKVEEEEEDLLDDL